MAPTNIQSTSELISIALAAERAAVRRYTGLTKKMRADGNQEAADVYARLVKKEKKHEKKITEWAALEGMVVDDEAVSVRWEDPSVQRVALWAAQMLEEARTDTNAALRRLNTDSDRSFTFYNSVVESTDDEAVMLMAQEQSALALQRNVALRQLNYPASNQPN